MPIPYADLHDKEEDERITSIGTTVMTHKKTVGFLVDDEPGKAGRYIGKLQERYPGIRVIRQMPGPVDGVVTVMVGPPVN